mgnify:CR=1 FL=1
MDSVLLECIREIYGEHITSKIINKKQLGLSILEALMATAVVGIGFVAVFQMVNYSVQSIDVSSERTKAKN